MRKTMKPREELANQILETKTGDITKTLKPYAIGKWVPVSERLPEFKNEYWSGYMIEDGRIINDIRSEVWFITGNATHWLELDMPEVGE